MKIATIICLVAALAIGCGTVTTESPADGGTGGAAGKSGEATGGAAAPGTGGTAGALGTGGQGQAGAMGTGGAAGVCGGADLTSDPNNCGACGRVCPLAEQSKPNDSQQLCYQGGCFIPSGDVCTSNAECITTDCAAQRLGGGPSQCQPKPCSASSDCPGVMPHCDDPLTNWARCQPSNYPDGGIANPCICSVL